MRGRGLATDTSTLWLHLVVMNRSTTYRQRSAKAFGRMFALISERVERQSRVLPDSFSRAPGDDMFIDMPDAHTVALVASHLGAPIQSLRAGKYDLDGEDTQLNSSSLERYQLAVQALVERL